MSAPRVVCALLAASAALAALAVVAVSVTSAPDPPAAAGPRAADAPAPASATRPSPAVASAPAPPTADASFGQLLRTTERASIREAVVDHEPLAPGTVVRLAAEVEIVPGMHVNANPPSHDWIIPVEASVAGVDGVSVFEAFYPEAESRKFPYSEEPFLVYEGTFVVGLTLAIDAGILAGDRELEVTLDYQACNDEACFAPATTSAKLRLTVVADPADAVRVTSPLLERAPFPR